MLEPYGEGIPSSYSSVECSLGSPFPMTVIMSGPVRYIFRTFYLCPAWSEADNEAKMKMLGRSGGFLSGGCVEMKAFEPLLQHKIEATSN